MNSVMGVMCRIDRNHSYPMIQEEISEIGYHFLDNSVMSLISVGMRKKFQNKEDLIPSFILASLANQKAFTLQSLKDLAINPQQSLFELSNGVVCLFATLRPRSNPCWIPSSGIWTMPIGWTGTIENTSITIKNEEMQVLAGCKIYDIDKNDAEEYQIDLRGKGYECVEGIMVSINKNIAAFVLTYLIGKNTMHFCGYALTSKYNIIGKLENNYVVAG